MKSADYYDSLPYKMVVTPDVEGGGYVASFPDLPGCITYADTKEKAIANAAAILRHRRIAASRQKLLRFAAR